MYRIFSLFLFSVLICSTLSAQTVTERTIHESITVTSTAASLTSDNLNSTSVGSIKINVEGGDIRILTTGDSPTITSGDLIKEGSTITLSQVTARDLQFIKVSGSPVLKVNYIKGGSYTYDKAFPAEIKTSFADSSSLDAFGNLNVSQNYDLFDYAATYDNASIYFDFIGTNNGTASHNTNGSFYSLDVGTFTDKIVMQTRKYFPYIAGKGQQFVVTYVPGTPTANIRQRLGLFDEQDGVYLQYNGTQAAIVLRTFTAGTVTETVVNQEDWNVDTFDGSGPSSITLGSNTANIFGGDLQYLGVGRVRTHFNIGGVTKVVHIFDNANNKFLPYMSTATLPIRYEIEATGVISGTSSLKTICSTVSSKGAQIIPSYGYSASSGSTTVTVGQTSTPVMAIRMLGTYAGKTNRKSAQLLSTDVFVTTANAAFKIRKGYGIYSTNGTWAAVGGKSAVEYNTTLTTFTTPTNEVSDLSHFFVVAGGQGVNALPGTNDPVLSALGNDKTISLNVEGNLSEIIVLEATGMGGSPAIVPSMKWKEE